MSRSQLSDSTLRTILIVLAVIVLFPLLMMVFAFPLMGMMGWWGGYGPMMGGYGGTNGGVALSPLWGIGMMLVFLLVLLGVGYFLFRALVGAGRAAPADPAMAELRHAYARGDLTDEEFETRREKLQHRRD